jgi:DNA-directed RNA polymerase II subunit RPB2
MVKKESKVAKKKRDEKKEDYDYLNDCWDVMDSYFKLNNNKKIADYQYLSFDQFITKYIDDIFKQFNPIKLYNNYIPELNKHQLKLAIEFENYSIGNPIITDNDGETFNMTPQDARNRNLTYASELSIDIKFTRTLYTMDETKEEVNLDNKLVREIIIKNVNLGRIPIMVQSSNCYLEKTNGIMNKQIGECSYDIGGYFIINGNEKVIISQERIAENKIFAFRKLLSNKTIEYNVEVHSVLDDRFSVVMKNIITLNNKTNILYFDCPLFKEPINLFIVLKLLGIKNDKDLVELLCFDIKEPVIGTIISSICNETMINYKSIIKFEKITDDTEFINYIIKMIKYKNINKEYKMNNEDKIKYLYDGLEKKVLPHLKNNYINKSHYIGTMVRKLIKVKLDLIPFDKRDSFQNKRVETPGYLMTSLFRQCINRMIKDMQKNLNNELSKNYNVNSSDIIYNKIYQKEINAINDNNNISTENKKDKINHIKSQAGLNSKYRLNLHEMIKAVSEKKDILESLNANNIYRIIKITSIEGGIKYALATGNWGIKTTGDNKIKVGVAQVLSRLSYPSYMSHLRRVICPSDKKKKNGKILGPRKQDASQFGFICPAETPEGQQVGLVKNLALSATITMQLNSQPLILWLKRYVSEMPNTNFPILDDKVIIYVNGNIIGYTDKPNDIYKQFYKQRRLGKIHQHITVNWYHEHNEMYFFCYAGRLIRPVFVVKDGKLAITKKHIEYLRKNDWNWNYLVLPSLLATGELPDESVIDFIDTEESTNCLIAANNNFLNDKDKLFSNNYTHCEIHPGLMLGVLACVIPFSDHNQSPRNAYQSSMGKQAMGHYATNFLDKMDTHAYIMNYLETPIVRSHFAKYVNYNELPCGMNALVAIACYSGYNQEDSILLNKDSVDNGLFVTTHYHVYKDEEKKIQSNGREEVFCKPDIRYIADKRNNNYDKLDARGFVKVNTHVSDRDIIIGKKLPIKNKFINGKMMYKDCSTSLKSNEEGYIDKVFVNRNEEGYLNCKVKIRDERIPGIGSKFASRVGQKGTIGMVLPRFQMPFTASGLIPDIVMTPHAIPSRMTVGQLMETLLGKLSTRLGGLTHSTPFNDVDPERIIQLLEDNNFGYCGDEVLYSGITGKVMNVKLYFGPTYYQRLKHMVLDKIHSRNNGPVVLLTRQPAEGRSREGGLRIGEMETDAIQGHGAMSFLKERLMDVSDKFNVYVCSHCGNNAIVNPNEELYMCEKCNQYSDFKHLQIPYASKLLRQELQGVGINIKYKFNNIMPNNNANIDNNVNNTY